MNSFLESLLALEFGGRGPVESEDEEHTFAGALTQAAGAERGAASECSCVQNRLPAPYACAKESRCACAELIERSAVSEDADSEAKEGPQASGSSASASAGRRGSDSDVIECSSGASSERDVFTGRTAKRARLGRGAACGAAQAAASSSDVSPARPRTTSLHAYFKRKPRLVLGAGWPSLHFRPQTMREQWQRTHAVSDSLPTPLRVVAKHLQVRHSALSRQDSARG